MKTRTKIVIATLLVAACGGKQAAQDPPVEQVVVVPPATSATPIATAPSSSASNTPASDDGTVPYTADAKTRYAAAKALAAAGRTAEARAAFIELKRMFVYSKYARDTELQLVRLDLDSGDTRSAMQGLRQYLHDHRSDTRQEDLLEALLDLECKAGDGDSCNELHKLSIGFGTCTKDADCSVITEMPCCSCCVGEPKAMSKAWVAQSKAACAADSCSECILACPKFDPATAYRAVCVQNACSLKSK